MIAGLSSFGPLAPHYDLLMAQIPYDMWAGYLRLLFAQMDAAPEEILDVCCGTGTICELLAAEGFAMTGLDLSPGMIAAAKQKAAEKELDIDYHVADASDFNLFRSFEAACSFFDSFNYIIEPERLASAFQCVARHLQPGSPFIFDLNTAYAFEQRMFDQSDTRKKAVIQYDWKGDYDPESRIIRVQMTFKKGDEIFHECHVQRAHPQDEVVSFLKQAGFIEIAVFESYTLDPPRRKSDRVHYVCRLPFE